jgi:hypothetical protein
MDLFGNLGLRPVVAFGDFTVPFAIGILVFDTLRLSGDLLFGSS